MQKRRQSSQLITDEGVFLDKHVKRTKIFVFICIVISIILIVLGAGALITEITY
ncbi:MAG: hypothetical protein II169_02390 [Lachnospiraceae bacterium]|nr:hypothetical protein [Lachnospiraceae bacterium]MBQ5475570.1 hypothetical protein [Lachnospiraceae bacterium]